MENQDVYNLITQNLSDTNTFMSACYVNGTMKKLCSTKYYWEPIFIKNNLPLPQVVYHKTNDWIYEYHKTSEIMMYTISFINDIPHHLHIMPTRFNNFYNPFIKLNIKPYYEPEYLQDLENDGLTPHDIDEVFNDFSGPNVSYIDFYIENGLYIINFNLDTTDQVPFYANYEQLKNFIFYSIYHRIIKFSDSPVSSPRKHHF